MGKRFWLTILICVTLVLVDAYASTYSIPPAAVDVQKVYFGKPDAFSRAGEVDYEALIKASPEYSQLKKEKVEKGSGRYWILLSQASDRAVRAISTIGKESDYDLITAAGYLGGLSPAIPAENITDRVVAKITGKEIKK